MADQKKRLQFLSSPRKIYGLPVIDQTRQASSLCGHSDVLEDGADRWFCPSLEQSGEAVSVWLRGHGLLGEVVVVFFRQQGLCQYRLDEIKARRGRRFHLVEHGVFDEQGYSVGKPGSISLRILKPSVAVVEAAIRGATMQHCKLANERELSARESNLASRMRDQASTEA